MSLLIVKRSGDSWVVVNDCGGEVYRNMSKQQTVLAARQMAEANRTTLRVLGTDGQVLGETTYRVRRPRLIARQ